MGVREEPYGFRYGKKMYISIEEKKTERIVGINAV